MKVRIYQEAVHEIMQRGLRFSVRDLASRLGISTKTLYLHYDSKEAIISYIVDRSIQEMKDREKELMNDSSLSLKQKLFQALVNIPQGVAFSDIRVLHDLKKMYYDQWKKVDEYLNSGWDYIRLLVQEGIARKELRPFNLELFIHVYVGAMYRLMNDQAPVKYKLSLDEAISETVHLLLSGVFEKQNDK